MKKLLFSGAALVMILSSCQKDAPKPQPQAQTALPAASKPVPGTNYFQIENKDLDCHVSGGNCIPWTVHTGRKPQMVQTINIINNGTREEIRENFTANRAELITFIPAEIVDWVINGECTVEYSKMGNIPNVDWLLFKDGDIVLDYLRMEVIP